MMGNLLDMSIMYNKYLRVLVFLIFFQNMFSMESINNGDYDSDDEPVRVTFNPEITYRTLPMQKRKQTLSRLDGCGIKTLFCFIFALFIIFNTVLFADSPKESTTPSPAPGEPCTVYYLVNRRNFSCPSTLKTVMGVNWEINRCEIQRSSECMDWCWLDPDYKGYDYYPVNGSQLEQVPSYFQGHAGRIAYCPKKGNALEKMCQVLDQKEIIYKVLPTNDNETFAIIYASNTTVLPPSPEFTIEYVANDTECMQRIQRASDLSYWKKCNVGLATHSDSLKPPRKALTKKSRKRRYD